MFDPSQPRLQLALTFVKQAMRLSRTIQEVSGLKAAVKSDNSPVTVADFSIQSLFGAMIQDQFPDDEVLAEEDSKMIRQEEALCDRVLSSVRTLRPSAQREDIFRWIDHGKPSQKKSSFWTLDPIDGTKGYLRGEQYCVALSWVVDGCVEFALIGCPQFHEKKINGAGSQRMGSLALAIRGQGAWIQDLDIAQGQWSQLRVSGRRTSSEIIPLGSVEKSHSNESQTESLKERLKIIQPPILVDSMVKYVMLAAGCGDFFTYFLPRKNPNYRMKIWDVAPGALVVEEAGGRVSDLNGQVIDYSMGESLSRNPGILVTNGCCHEAILGAIHL